MISSSDSYTLPFDPKQSKYSQVKVNFSGGDYSSKLVSTLAFKKDAVVAKLSGLTQSTKAWTSVQVGIDSHIELNSELVYMNHSCDPSVIICPDTLEIKATRDLNEGDELTFFYPSTEWEMSQPFECWCGFKKCLKTIAGAKDVSSDVLSGFVLADHIVALLKIRDQS